MAMVKCKECKGDRKDKPIIGMTILWGLKQDGDEWNGGEILDPAQAAELAQPFRRLGADRTGSDDGAGLGLSIVAAITQAHRGSLQLHARPGGGLKVTITLPLAPRAVAITGSQAGVPA